MKKKNSFLKGALCGALAMLLAVAFVGGSFFIYKMSRDDKVVTMGTEKKLETLRGLIDEVYLHSDEISDDELKVVLVIRILFIMTKRRRTVCLSQQKESLVELVFQSRRILRQEP